MIIWSFFVDKTELCGVWFCSAVYKSFFFFFDVCSSQKGVVNVEGKGKINYAINKMVSY